MVIKVYCALITCSQEVKKNQTRAVMILESKNIPYVAIDITDPGQEDAKDYMLANAQPKPGAKVPVPPQIFNEADYCGDFDTLDMSNECDSLGDFLKLTDDEKKVVKIGITGILPGDRQKAKEEEKKAAPPMTNGHSNANTEKPTQNGTTEEKPKETAPPVEVSPVADSEPSKTSESPEKVETPETPAKTPTEKVESPEPTKETPPTETSSEEKPTEPATAPAEA